MLYYVNLHSLSPKLMNMGGKEKAIGRFRFSKIDLFSHLSETILAKSRQIWVNKCHQVFWVKQSNNKASDITTTLNQHSSASASSCNLFHQVFCYLCANVFLIGWIHRLRDLRSV
jgi:hypothetical protein